MDELLAMQRNLRDALSECGQFLEEVFINGIKTVLKDEEDAEKFVTYLKRFKSTYEELEVVDKKIIKTMLQLLMRPEEIEEMERDIEIFRKRWKKMYDKVVSILNEGNFEKKGILFDVLSTVVKAGVLTGAVIGGLAFGLNAAGFKSGGVAKNSRAAKYQSSNYGGHTPGDSWFSTFQRMGVKEPSSSTVFGVTAVSALLSTAHTLFSKK